LFGKMFACGAVYAILPIRYPDRHSFQIQLPENSGNSLIHCNVESEA